MGFGGEFINNNTLAVVGSFLTNLSCVDANLKKHKPSSILKVHLLTINGIQNFFLNIQITTSQMGKTGFTCGESQTQTISLPTER